MTRRQLVRAIPGDMAASKPIAELTGRVGRRTAGLARSLRRAFRADWQRSYSQCGEDLILRFLLLDALHLSDLTYLDIGAGDARRASNTFLFYRMGFRGVCVEPLPALARKIRKRRPGDVCINAGAGICDDVRPFYVIEPSVLRTFNTEAASRATELGHHVLRVVSIPIIPVAKIVERNFAETPALVSLDIEGGEAQVLSQLLAPNAVPLPFVLRRYPTLAELWAQSARKSAT